MHVFVTGATGWVGSAVVDDLLAAGHRVSGLVRSPAKAEAMARAGATAVEGTLDDLGVLQEAARASDAVIHTAFNHDFANFAKGCEQDRRAIEVFGEALQGSDRPLLVTSGLALVASGRPALETDPAPSHPAFPRRSELTAVALAARGVRAATVRLASSVHGLGDYGFVPILIDLARRTGVSAYVGEGDQQWSGIHRTDAARVYRLALETGLTSPVYHATADEMVPFRDIATIIGRRLGLPVEPRTPDHFGWFSHFAAMDFSGASALTRQRLGWTPSGPSLLADIDQPGYFEG